jgi:organic hydroperoxide reductase OsmC/OhrA
VTSYPVSFHARAQSALGISSLWNIESVGKEVTCAIPPEFEGPGGGLSPEDLFAQALTNCFVATFKVYAEKSKLNYSNVDVQTELVVDLGDTGKPVMAICRLRVNISGCEKPDRIRTIAQKAFESGFILNSVKTKLEFEISVT